MLGDRPRLPDALTYALVWFVRGRWKKGPEFLAQFPALCAWENRVKELGHGQPSDMRSGNALEVARSHEIATPEHIDPNDPQLLVLGQNVEVLPEGDGGDPAVRGKFRFADRETIAIVRADNRVGQVCVHFPRVGYRVRLLI